MKLRITENSIRVRLSRSDIQQLSSGQVQDLNLSFGSNALTFTLMPSKVEPNIAIVDSDSNQNTIIDVVYDQNEVRITIEKSVLATWINSRENQLKLAIAHPNNHTLSVLVEKDYLG